MYTSFCKIGVPHYLMTRYVEYSTQSSIRQVTKPRRMDNPAYADLRAARPSLPPKQACARCSFCSPRIPETVGTAVSFCAYPGSSRCTCLLLRLSGRQPAQLSPSALIRAAAGAAVSFCTYPGGSRCSGPLILSPGMLVLTPPHTGSRLRRRSPR